MGRRKSDGSNLCHGNNTFQWRQKPENRLIPLFIAYAGNRRYICPSSRTCSSCDSSPLLQASQEKEIGSSWHSPNRRRQKQRNLKGQVQELWKAPRSRFQPAFPFFAKPSIKCSKASSGCKTIMRGPAKRMTLLILSCMTGLEQWMKHFAHSGLFCP